MDFVRLSGLVLFLAGFAGAGLQDWRAFSDGGIHGAVSDWWLALIVPGAAVYAHPWALSEFYFAGGLIVFGYVAMKSGQMGGGDVLPLALSGFALDKWCVVALLVIVAGQAWFTHRRDTGPLMFFAALGVSTAVLFSWL